MDHIVNNTTASTDYTHQAEKYAQIESNKLFLIQIKCKPLII